MALQSSPGAQQEHPTPETLLLLLELTPTLLPSGPVPQAAVSVALRLSNPLLI